MLILYNFGHVILIEFLYISSINIIWFNIIIYKYLKNKN